MPVTISFGVESKEEDLAGATVKQARESVAGTFGIPENAVSMVNGKPVDENYVLQDGDILKFDKKTSKFLG